MDRHQGFTFHCQLKRDGQVVDSWTAENLIPTEGLEYMLGVSLLSAVETASFLGVRSADGRRDVRYVFNLVDMRRKLTREVLALLRRRLGQSMMGIVNYDDSFGDAGAHQQLLVDRAPVSKAAADVRGVAAAPGNGPTPLFVTRYRLALGYAV